MPTGCNAFDSQYAGSSAKLSQPSTGVATVFVRTPILGQEVVLPDSLQALTKALERSWSLSARTLNCALRVRGCARVVVQRSQFLFLSWSCSSFFLPVGAQDIGRPFPAILVSLLLTPDPQLFSKDTINERRRYTRSTVRS